ncbi:MAG: hypothetical protein Q8O67_20700 [Deltaproteobacteria bacterium]|nr:hypothetical protein [Deltaproteobacteria bacterium]
MDPLHFDDDDDKEKKQKTDEFECPECNAHNPIDDGFHVGSQVTCFYCGVEFNVLDAGGRFKFKPS